MARVKEITGGRAPLKAAVVAGPFSLGVHGHHPSSMRRRSTHCLLRICVIHMCRRQGRICHAGVRGRRDHPEARPGGVFWAPAVADDSGFLWLVPTAQHDTASRGAA